MRYIYNQQPPLTIELYTLKKIRSEYGGIGKKKAKLKILDGEETCLN